MLEPATLQNHNQNDVRPSRNEQTPTTEQNPNDSRYDSLTQWVNSIEKHPHDDKQSTQDEDELDSDSNVALAASTATM